MNAHINPHHLHEFLSSQVKPLSVHLPKVPRGDDREGHRHRGAHQVGLRGWELAHQIIWSPDSCLQIHLPIILREEPLEEGEQLVGTVKEFKSSLLEAEEKKSQVVGIGGLTISE